MQRRSSTSTSIACPRRRTYRRHQQSNMLGSLRQLPRIFFGPAPEAPPPAPLDDSGLPKVYRGVPPLRQSPFEPDEFDSRRVEYAKPLSHGHDPLLRARDRQIEDDIPLPCGP